MMSFDGQGNGSISTVDLFAFSVETHPEAVFSRTPGEPLLHYREAYDLVAQTAAALTGHGLTKGDRLAVLAGNRLEFTLLMLGCLAAGIIPVPLNRRLKVADWAYIVEHSRSRALVVGDGHELDAVAITQELRAPLPLVMFLDEAPDVSNATPFPRTVASADARELRSYDVRGDDAAYQIYTSGTTSRPKGIVLTHDALRATIHQLAVLHHDAGILGRPLQVVAPMFHSGITVQWLTTIAFGGTLTFVRDFKPKTVLHSLAEDEVEWTMLMPTMIELCLLEGLELDFSPLRAILYGGSSINPATLRRATDYFGCDFIQLYGLSETNPISVLTPTDHRRALSRDQEILSSAGRAIPGIEVSVRGVDGAECEAGQVGEITARGPQQMVCYWEDPERTTAMLRNGWIYTNDAGCWDEHGFLHVVGRLDDMIVSGGENIYPDEIEATICTFGPVLEAAVVGTADATWGQAVTAVVVWKEGQSPDVEGLRRHARGALPAFKCPKRFISVDKLPRNAAGKLLRRSIREQFDGDGSWVPHGAKAGTREH